MSDEWYADWRQHKLPYLESASRPSFIPVKDPQHLSARELAAMACSVERHNLVLYDCPNRTDKGWSAQESRQILIAVCRQLGLTHPLTNPTADHDGISCIEAVQRREGPTTGGDRGRYIPFSHQRLDWHTDGYYNPDHHRVRTFALHCVRRAASGGENRLLDPDLLYILLRDQSPVLAHALSHPETLCIPADDRDPGSERRAFQGAVFSLDPVTRTLYTRFTRRRHNIQWRDETHTRAALARIDSILDRAHPAILRLTLNPGQGIICHNLLHCRTAFTDRPGEENGRLLYRLRYHQRMTISR